MQRTFEKINDPGHGWLKVPYEVWQEVDPELECLSSYSYARPRIQRGKFDGWTLYLEEDCDMSKFLDKWYTKYPGQVLDIRHRESNRFAGRYRQDYHWTREGIHYYSRLIGQEVTFAYQRS